MHLIPLGDMLGCLFFLFVGLHFRPHFDFGKSKTKKSQASANAGRT